MDQVWIPLYDAHDAALMWWLMPLASSAIAFLILSEIRNEFPLEIENAHSDDERLKLRPVLAVACFITCILFWVAWQNSVVKVRALNSGQFKQVMGPITAFVQTPWKGHAQDIFSVQDHRFLYSDFDAQSENGSRVSNPGCLKNGLPTRVSFTGNLVLRVEIKVPRDSPGKICHARWSPEIYQSD